MALGISVGMLSRKKFEILDVVVGILVLFELLILWQILFKFFVLNSESFTKHGTLCSHIFHSCVLKMLGSLLSKRSKLWKNCRLFTKNNVKMAAGECIPKSAPGFNL